MSDYGDECIATLHRWVDMLGTVRDDAADESAEHILVRVLAERVTVAARLADVERERDEARALAVAMDDLVSDMAGPEYTGEDEYTEMRDTIEAWKAGAR